MRKPLKLIKNLYLKKKNPVSLIIVLTNRCNARCSFCFINFDKNAPLQNKNNELGCGDFKKIANSVRDSLHHVDFTGGEPFLKNDFIEIAENFIEICDLNSVVITTNGSYPRKISDFIEKVCKKNISTKFIFQISIDSFPDKHDKIRKIPGLFNKAMESHNIIKNGPQNCISICNLTVSEENYKDVIDLYDFLKDKHSFETINPIIVRDEGVYKIPVSIKENLINAYKKLTDRIIDDKKKEKYMKKLSNFSIERTILNAKDKIAYRMTAESYLKPKFYTYCVAGSIFGVIQSDGTVYPCEILEKKPLGNLKEYDFNFLDLWQDANAQATRKWIKDTKCNCHWECIKTYNLISSPKYATKLLEEIISG